MPDLTLQWLSPELQFLLGLIALAAMSFFGASPTPVPLPITLTLLWLGQFGMPIPVILTATAATLVGWVCLEGMFRKLTSHPRLQKAIPANYQRFFLRRTGFWLFFFNALPFPWDPMRFLALMNDYPRTRFLWLLGGARLIRHTILVTMGAALAQYKLVFWLALAFFLLLPMLTNRLVHFIFARIRPDEPLLREA